MLKVLFLFWLGLALLNFFGVNEILSLCGGMLAMAIPLGDIYRKTNLGYGRIAQHHPNTYTQTKAAEGEILFGRAVEFGTTRDQVKTCENAEFVGIAMYSTQASKVSEEKYSSNDVVGVCTSGYITVYVEEAVNAGDVVRVRYVNGSTPEKVKGNFCKTAETGKTFKLEGASFETSTTTAGEVVVFLSGSFKVVAD